MVKETFSMYTTPLKSDTSASLIIDIGCLALLT